MFKNDSEILNFLNFSKDLEKKVDLDCQMPGLGLGLDLVLMNFGENNQFWKILEKKRILLRNIEKMLFFNKIDKIEKY